jgi:hypothetical protein
MHDGHMSMIRLFKQALLETPPLSPTNNKASEREA